MNLHTHVVRQDTGRFHHPKHPLVSPPVSPNPQATTVGLLPSCLLLSALEQDLNGWVQHALGFPGGAVAKNPPYNEEANGDVVFIPGSGRSPGGGNGNPRQDACLGNPMERGAWWAAVQGVGKSQTGGGTERAHTTPASASGPSGLARRGPDTPTVLRAACVTG